MGVLEKWVVSFNFVFSMKRLKCWYLYLKTSQNFMHFLQVFCDSFFLLENVSTDWTWHCLYCLFHMENHIDPVSQPPSWWLAVCSTTSTTTMSHIFFSPGNQQLAPPGHKQESSQPALLPGLRSCFSPSSQKPSLPPLGPPPHPKNPHLDQPYYFIPSHAFPLVASSMLLLQATFKQLLYKPYKHRGGP